MTFAEAERRYGSDKPDLRNPMEPGGRGRPVKAVEFAVSLLARLTIRKAAWLPCAFRAVLP